jgi:drug/metabolite transporter (DMT)-like permease
MFYFSIVIVILSNVLYHAAQKSVAPSVHPLVATVVAYLAAIALCLLAFPFFPLQNTIQEELRRINWSSYALGVSIVGVELGYLLAYRAGWEVNIGSVVANVAIGILLVPIGIWMFKESVSWTTIAGIVLCLAGVALIAKR